MKLLFVSNYLNHHQIPFCNELHNKYKNEFAFIQTMEMEKERLNMGWQQVGDIPYLKKYYEAEKEIQEMIDTADIVIFGGVDEESYIQTRLQRGKVVVRYSERIYKEGQWRAISPRGLRKKYIDHTKYRKSKVYLLCAGGYVPSDFNIVKAYPNKMYKWGYFPETKMYDIDDLMEKKGYKASEADEFKLPYILWAARMIDWKHPEICLRVVEKLILSDVEFHMDMIGVGPLEEKLKNEFDRLEEELKDLLLKKNKRLGDYFSFVGMKTPGEVRQMMEKANIYLVTSDRNEGWGAVVNEAMNSGCAVVTNYMIGAAPYLIRDCENGFIYKDKDLDSLTGLVGSLVMDVNKVENVGKEAYKTIVNEWNAKEAADRLIKQFDLWLEGKSDTVYLTGPMSKAEVISERKMYKHLKNNGFGGK